LYPGGYAVHDFRKLDVYRRALEFSSTVRRVTRTFPKDEMFVLASQYRRAADSIVLNIAEGAGSGSKKEFAKFLGYSIRSGYECSCCADISTKEKFITKEEYANLLDETDQIISMLIGLQRSLKV
jgi:four helix bundle protein